MRRRNVNDYVRALVVRGNMLMFSRSIAQLLVEKSKIGLPRPNAFTGRRRYRHDGKSTVESPKHRDPTQIEPPVQYKNGRWEHPAWGLCGETQVPVQQAVS